VSEPELGRRERLGTFHRLIRQPLGGVAVELDYLLSALAHWALDGTAGLIAGYRYCWRFIFNEHY